MKKAKRIATLAVAGALVGTCGISAYFTATDTATNKFNVEEVDTKLDEPGYTDGQKVTPNETIVKDPTVENTGNTDQYVFLSVKVPFKNIVTAELDGTRNAAADTELFVWNTAEAGTINTLKGDNGGKVNTGWTLIKTIVGAEDVEYIYAWGSATEMTKLAAGGKTAPLFNSVTMCNAIEGQGLENSDVLIDINLYAIQTEDLDRAFGETEGTKVPEDVYSIYAEQWNSEAANEAISTLK